MRIIDMMNKKRVIIMVIVCIILALLIYLTLSAISIWNYGEIDEKRKADVAIVLGAGTANGEVSPVYRERINHGIWLFENDYVDYIILTGGVGDENTESDAFVAKKYAISQGIPKEQILIEEQSTITEENIEQSKIIMDDNLLKTAIIVSDPLHMKRASLMARDYGIEAYSSPTQTTMYKSKKTQLAFLVREEFFYVGYQIVRVFR